MEEKDFPLIIQQAVEYHSFRLMSRSHPISSFSKKDCRFFIKREDELSFGISGSKLRKYPSLIDHLKNTTYSKIGAIGSSFSNNIVGLSQLLTENNLPFHLFLLKPNAHPSFSSNAFLLSLLNPSITWVERRDWGKVEEIAAKSCDFVLPEGCFTQECLSSSLTLGLDILKNETDLNITFDHIIIDSGTGFMGILLLLFFQLMTIEKSVHIVSLADPLPLFEEKLRLVASWMGTTPTYPYHFHAPATAKSFGSINQTITDFIKQFAQTDGIFLDPIYSAKAFYTFQHKILDYIDSGKCLIIHSGGGTSLFGFKDHF